MRNAATDLVEELVKIDKRVLAITADNRNESYERIMKKYPDQYIEYGIAEENMLASSAGLASCGKIPFLYTITNFMSMHSYEFLRNDICIAAQNVKLLGRSAGLVSSSMGPTHQGTEELGLLRPLPNLVTITPSTPVMAKEAVRFAYEHEGPVYIRLEGRGEKEYYDDSFVFESGKTYPIKDGRDVAIISMGSIITEAVKAAEMLERDFGVSAAVLDVPTSEPIEKENVLYYIDKCRLICSLEEHSIKCGLGSVIAEIMAENGARSRLLRIGLSGCVDICADREGIRKHFGLDYCSVAKRIIHSLEGKTDGL